MITLAGISAHVPDTVVPIEAVCGPQGLSRSEAKLFRRYYGLDTVRWAATSDLADILLAAAGKLAALRGREHQVRYVVAARTLQKVSADPTAILTRVCRELGLSTATAFALTQHACASGLLAVYLAGQLLADGGDPDALALVLAGEKAFTPTAQFIPATTVMGEGTAAVLVGIDGPGERVLSYATHTDGRFRDGLLLAGELSAQFHQAYGNALCDVMSRAARQAGLDLAEVDLVIPHNVNRVSWVRLCQAIGYPVERVFLDNVPVLGHCFGADPFINLASALERGRVRPGDRYLMVSVGLGATFSAMVAGH
ncbi:MAG: 3-oxoacyl-[acyl-carrier-protein] synthase [Micromonosporaceae bacterium]